MRQDERRTRQAGQPSEPERLRILRRLLDIEGALQIATKQCGLAGPEPSGGRQGRSRLSAVGDRIQLRAGLVQLPGQ